MSVHHSKNAFKIDVKQGIESPLKQMDFRSEGGFLDLDCMCITYQCPVPFITSGYGDP